MAFASPDESTDDPLLVKSIGTVFKATPGEVVSPFIGILNAPIPGLSVGLADFFANGMPIPAFGDVDDSKEVSLLAFVAPNGSPFAPLLVNSRDFVLGATAVTTSFISWAS